MVAGLILLLIFTAFYHGGDAMFRASNKLSIEILKNKNPKISRVLSNLYDFPVLFLSSILIGSIFFLALYVLVFNRLLLTVFDQVLPEYPIVGQIATIWIIASLVVVIGKYLPKVIFGGYANELITKLAIPLFISKWIFVIPGWLLIQISSGLSRLLYGKSENNDDTSFTKGDLESYIQTNIHEEKEIDKEILNNALNLNQLRVRDCMIPRNEIVFVDKTDTIQTAKTTFLTSKHSRLIVVDDDLEHILGYIHHQQLFESIKSVAEIVMQIDIIPDVMNVQDLMYKFIKQGTNIACVVDEFGGTSGLITLEDILEEIFGEIADEHDEEFYTEEMISDHEYVFSGRLELAYLNDKYAQLNFPEEDYTTLSGYIVMTLGSIPEIGEEIAIDDYVFNVISRSETKIEEVRVRIQDQDSDQI
ncbi:MAG: hemolysin family protein [Chitinophagales bacterium]|nr:hemolysin family protein [Chitinophagales bacterium]